MKNDNFWKIWCDGSCILQEKMACGWGAVIQAPDDKIILRAGFLGFGKDNQFAEMGAIRESLLLTPKGSNVLLHSDSNFVLSALMSNFCKIAKNPQNKSILNGKKSPEEWLALCKAYQERNVYVQWIEGHAGHPQNTMADRLARIGAESFALHNASNSDPASQKQQSAAKPAS